MKPRARPSLRREVLIFTFAVCGLVLIATGALLFAHHLHETRARLSEAVQSTTNIVAANIAAALAFRDPTAAAEILESLRHNPQLVSAVLYDRDNQPFVRYDRPDSTESEAGESASIPVVFRGESLGYLEVRSDAGPALRNTALAWALAFTAALALAGLLAYLLARRFQNAVAYPLIELSNTARKVTKHGDYRLRFTPHGSPEVVTLGEAFNTMLAEVERRDEALDRQVESLNAEIRRREAAEETLRQNARELARISHQAGIAEIATGVLHNIGNALTSINVSAELLADALQRRVREPVVKARDFFRSPTPRAAAVFSSHPDGPALRDAAAAAIAASVEALNQAGEELNCLRAGVAHLREIVVRQQKSARLERHISTFDLMAAVDQALALDHTAGRQDLEIEVKVLGDPLPKVSSDRAAVEQILLNLLSNARDALAAARVEHPRILITVGPPTAEHLPVAVTDNGMGIAPDKLLSIFSYGFTTKEHGHGFGLHNSANLARMLGGSLHARSDGLGHGATFILEVTLASATPPPHDPA